MAARLPGAPNLDTFWDVLRRGKVTVSPFPTGRFSVERFLNKRETAPGFSYTFAGGYLDNPFGFDAEAFGISAREAAQMDPQQRILLEVVWEALEDAGIPPSQTAGQEVGVYVGASNVDYQNSVAADQSAIESHFVTGIALSIVSNRVSYVFDWKGPSMTIDTACSSSMVALSRALDDLANDRIPLAVVAGVNMLLSPVPYIGFSRARMLSPTGLCRPFSADADGYVRSEGAVALVLRKGRAGDAGARAERVRAEILGAGVNSDGRTVGVSLPSADGQARLLHELYARLEVDPDNIAFVEAHGTGTRVGDPVEAEAIGRALGEKRGEPLTIGSVKSNIGHLESASGVAGLAKAILALQHRVYPRTLHLDALNPDISFEAWGLMPAREDRRPAVPAKALLQAGVCNYGFGGTNAHVVLSSPCQSIQSRSHRHAQLSSESAGVLPLGPDHARHSARSPGTMRAIVAANAGRELGLASISAVHVTARLAEGTRSVPQLETPGAAGSGPAQRLRRGRMSPALAAARGTSRCQSRHWCSRAMAANGSAWALMRFSTVAARLPLRSAISTAILNR
jgi:phthiocerol/phenolphthiocerol synthesis type-I polyketide synthase C